MRDLKLKRLKFEGVLGCDTRAVWLVGCEHFRGFFRHLLLRIRLYTEAGVVPDSRAGHVGFMIVLVALLRVFLSISGFPSLFHQYSVFIHLPQAGILGPLATLVSWDPSLPCLKNNTVRSERVT
jgi:hypothetical protein